METEFLLEEMHERLIRNFMDIIFLVELRKGYPISGYDLIEFIHKKFHILMSSGTVYSALYSLERTGLIEGTQASQKRIYKLTSKGEEILKALLENREKIQSLVATLF